MLKTSNSPYMLKFSKIAVSAALLFFCSQSTNAESLQDREDVTSGLFMAQRGDYPGAIEKLEPLAQKGNVSAQYQLAIIYYVNTPVADMNKAIHWFKLAGNQGHIEAQYILGNEFYLDKQYKQAHHWYLKAAKQGHSTAQGFLADLYMYGNGVKEDRAVAYEWYSKSAELGDPHGQKGLGMMYYIGGTVKQDYKKAFAWAYKAAIQGNSSAQNIIGDMYFEGLGILQDYTLAHMWTNIANQNGDHYAAKNLQIISAVMSPVQITEAQKMASACYNSDYKNCSH